MISKYEIRLHGQAVKTLASHAGIRGSIPLGVTWLSSQRENFERIFSVVFLAFISYNPEFDTCESEKWLQIQ